MKGFRQCQRRYDSMEHPDFYRQDEELKDEEESSQDNDDCDSETLGEEV